VYKGQALGGLAGLMAAGCMGLLGYRLKYIIANNDESKYVNKMITGRSTRSPANCSNFLRNTL